jgi:hypothetical protein
VLVFKSEKEEEESRGTEGARRATGVARESAPKDGVGPDPEVTDKATRRRFSAGYKRRIVIGGRQAHQAWGIGGLVAPGGCVFVEPEHLAAATGFRRVGGHGFEARTESATEGRAG